MPTDSAAIDPDTRRAVERLISDALQEFGFEDSEISFDTPLEDLGVSSLDIAELIQIVREQYGATVQAYELAACASLAEVTDMIAAKVVAARDA